MRRHKAVLCQAATGFGKTKVAAHMIKAAQAKGSRSMFIVPRRELLRQTAASFSDEGISFGFVAAGYERNPFARTILATSGTLARRMDDAPVMDVVFVDETHHGGAELERIIKHYRAAGAWVIGLSATPSRLDGKGLGDWYSAMECGPPVADLIKSGRLSRYRAFAPAAPDLTGVRTVAGDYAKGELAGRMEADRVLVGNAVSHYAGHAMGRLNVAYCASIKHAEIVAAAFLEKGIPAAAITGAMDDDERSRLVKAFARRQLLVLTNCDLLTFGFDLASSAQMDVTVDSMSDLGPTKSLARQMQKWGRVLRMKPDPALIFDHAGNFAHHGLPDDPRGWTLAGRDKKGRDSEPTLPTRQCPQCYWVSRPCPVCPGCGFVYPVQSRTIDEVEGVLQELDPNREIPVENETGRTFRQTTQAARSLDALIAIGQRRGMKNPAAWAAHVMTARMAGR